MAIIKYDVSDVEAGGGGEAPQPGMYAGKIVGITHRTKKKNAAIPVNDLEVVVDVGEEYTRLYTYIKLPGDPSWDQSKWKFREFADALGLPPGGSIDTSANSLKKLFKPVNVKVSADTDGDGDYRGRIKNLFKPGKVTAENGDGGDGDGNAEGPYGREEMEGWSDEDLKGYAEELGVEIPSGRGAKAKLLDALVMAESEGSDDSEPDAAGSGLLDGISEDVLNELKTDADYYSDWSDDDVKQFLADLGIDGNVATSGRGWRPKAVAAIVELAESGGGGTNGDTAEVEGEAEADTYDDADTWPDSDLKAEIEERNAQGAEIKIPGRSTRQKMIDALRVDDKEAAKEPF